LHKLYFILNNFYVTASPTTATTSLIIESTQPTIRTESGTTAEESEETTLGSLNTPTDQGEAEECPACGTCSCPPTAPPTSPSHLDWGLGGGQDAARNSGDHYTGTVNYIGTNTFNYTGTNTFNYTGTNTFNYTGNVNFTGTVNYTGTINYKGAVIVFYTGTGTINYTGTVKITKV
jgi:hypothetical protein